jgi:hypothetical protein
MSKGEVMVPVSVGELVDKLTILDIKLAHVRDDRQRANIAHEQSLLAALVAPIVAAEPDVQALQDQLRAINATLWDVEDRLREHERNGVFDDDFVQLARQVYHRNDERARLKKAINETTGSAIVEEKLYADY